MQLDSPTGYIQGCEHYKPDFPCNCDVKFADGGHGQAYFNGKKWLVLVHVIEWQETERF